jgi:hypothetical protein
LQLTDIDRYVMKVSDGMDRSIGPATENVDEYSSESLRINTIPLCLINEGLMFLQVFL